MESKTTTTDEAVETAIHPDTFYPASISIKLRHFGVGRSQYWEAVRKGLLPRPVHAYPGSQMRGNYGRTILKYQRERQATAKTAGKVEQQIECEGKLTKQKRRATR